MPKVKNSPSLEVQVSLGEEREVSVAQDSHISGLYIHIPFCRKRCPYCDFAILPSKINHELGESYVRLLAQDFEQTIREHHLNLGDLTSIYFGGGTPSTVAPELLGSLFKNLSAHEISIEVNPEDVTTDYLLKLADVGFTRISIGIQTFNTELLKKLGRAHLAEDNFRALELLAASPLEQSVDLICGIPSSSIEDMVHDIDQVAKVGHLNHLSLYALTAELGTPFYQAIMKGQITHEHADSDLFLRTGWQLLESLGFEQYEISNFARSGDTLSPKRSLHNSLYWRHKPYLGIGIGAHSFYQQKRSCRVKELKSYQESLQNNRLPIAWEEAINPITLAQEKILLGLRLRDGISLECMEERFINRASRLIESGHLIKKNGRLLASLEGKLVLNSVLEHLLDD